MDNARILEHYAASPVIAVSSCEQGEPDMKPEGFWVSVKGEYDWPSFCKSEGFRLDTLQFRHSVELADTANILWLTEPWQIDDLDLKYARNPGAMPSYWVDWRALAERYDGIIIAPYQWSRRLDGPSWYYGWDCASGCIWNASAISSIVVAEDYANVAMATPDA